MVGTSSTTGYFADDFNSTELKMLRVKQRMDGRSTLYNNFFEIPTLDEITALASNMSVEYGRTVGMYIELKKPEYFHDEGFEMEDMFISKMTSLGYDTNPSSDDPSLIDISQSNVVPFLIQCFNTTSLQYIRDSISSTLPLVQVQILKFFFLNFTFLFPIYFLIRTTTK